MKNLTYPHIDNIALWDRIVSHKHQSTKNILLPLREKINARYIFYSEHFDSLDEIYPLPQTEWANAKSELISCYGTNVEFKKIKQLLFSNLSATNQTKCPYCMLNRPNTMDHYFDKADYPEFSAYVPNIIPCCSECNTSKNTSVFNSQRARKYIHFYHDPIPEEQFLYVRFYSRGSDPIPTVSITLRFSEENYCSNLLQRHFSDLSLISKYQSAIIDRLAPILEEIQMYQQNGVSTETITGSLQIKLKSLSDYYGHNYWEACIYEGILNSPDFLEKLLSA